MIFRTRDTSSFSQCSTPCKGAQDAKIPSDTHTPEGIFHIRNASGKDHAVIGFAASLLKALLRGVAQAAGEITALVQEGIGEAGEILEAAEQKIYAVRRGQSAQDMVPLRMVLPAATALLANFLTDACLIFFATLILRY